MARINQLNYVSVAGLVLDRLERIAGIGDSVVVDGVMIEVLEVDGFAIEQVMLRVDPAADIDGEAEPEAGSS